MTSKKLGALLRSVPPATVTEALEPPVAAPDACATRAPPPRARSIHFRLEPEVPLQVLDSRRHPQAARPEGGGGGAELSARLCCARSAASASPSPMPRSGESAGAAMHELIKYEFMFDENCNPPGLGEARFRPSRRLEAARNTSVGTISEIPLSKSEAGMPQNLVA